MRPSLNRWYDRSTPSRVNPADAATRCDGSLSGFTTISMYPRMWAASGVDYPSLLAAMVDTAVARGTGLR